MDVPLVCDYGSGFSKVGFAGMETPLAVFPTLLGKLRHDVSCSDRRCAQGCRGVRATRLRRRVWLPRACSQDRICWSIW